MRTRAASHRYDDQALAAMRRCLEVADGGGPWGWVADSVRIALDARDGHKLARRDLDENPAWQLKADGSLP